MRHFLVSLLLIAAAGAPAWAADNTGLDRLTLRSEVLGWEGVGRLELGHGGFCSGVLVAPNQVLTAAHCVDDARAEGRVDHLRFRAGLTDGAAIAEADVARAVIHPDWQPGIGVTANNIAADVALVELAEPIPAATAAPFRVAPAPAAGAPVSVVSYGAGRAEALSRQAVCTVVGRRPQLIAFDCDVTFGSSGAPVFDLSTHPARIVSLVSSGGADVAFGMDLPQAVATLQRAFVTGKGVFPKRDFAPTRLTPGTRGTAGKFVRPPGS